MGDWAKDRAVGLCKGPDSWMSEPACGWVVDAPANLVVLTAAQTPESEFALLLLLGVFKSLTNGDEVHISKPGEDVLEATGLSEDGNFGLAHSEGPAVADRRGGPKPSGTSVKVCSMLEADGKTGRDDEFCSCFGTSGAPLRVRARVGRKDWDCRPTGVAAGERAMWMP